MQACLLTVVAAVVQFDSVPFAALKAHSASCATDHIEHSYAKRKLLSKLRCVEKETVRCVVLPSKLSCVALLRQGDQKEERLLLFLRCLECAATSVVEQAVLFVFCMVAHLNAREAAVLCFHGGGDTTLVISLMLSE